VIKIFETNQLKKAHGRFTTMTKISMDVLRPWAFGGEKCVFYENPGKPHKHWGCRLMDVLRP
jgi:hypothetical protein